MVYKSKPKVACSNPLLHVLPTEPLAAKLHFKPLGMQSDLTKLQEVTTFQWITLQDRLQYKRLQKIFKKKGLWISLIVSINFFMITNANNKAKHIQRLTKGTLWYRKYINFLEEGIATHIYKLQIAFSIIPNISFAVPVFFFFGLTHKRLTRL